MEASPPLTSNERALSMLPRACIVSGAIFSNDAAFAVIDIVPGQRDTLLYQPYRRSAAAC